MLRTDGGGQDADPAPHKTEMTSDETRRETIAPSQREKAEAETPSKPAPTKSPDSGFGSFG